MKTENLSALEIHKLSQEQYDREYDAGNIDETAIYLTTDDGTEQELTQTVNEDSTSTQVPSAKAVFELISGVDSASLKYVENPNLWELNSGLYHIENGFYYKSDSQQTMTKGIMIISKKTDNLIYQIFQGEDVQYFGEISIDGSDGSCTIKEFSKSAAVENPSDNTYLSETAIVNLFNEVKSAIPETLPADGGNADTVDGKHAEDFADAEHEHEQYALKTDVSSSTQTLQESITQHTENTNIHVTLDEKATWNNKSDFSGDYNDLNNKPEIPSIEGLATETYVNEKVSQVDIPSALSELAEDETHRVVTDSEKAAWNAKSDFSGSYNDLTDKPAIPSIEGLATETYVDEKIEEIEIPTTLPASGGNADTVDGKHADEFASAEHEHTQYALSEDVSSEITDINNSINEHKDNKENPHNVTTEQINAVPVTRKINSKELNTDIELTAEDIGADIAGTAESKATEALNTAKEYIDSEVDKVENTLLTHTNATNPHNINAELLGVYTKSEVDTKTTELSDKIQENTDAITTLNGVGDGSVDKKITDAFNKFVSDTGNDDTIDSYKELIDYAAEHGAEFTNLVGEVTSNKNNLTDLTNTVNSHTSSKNNPHNVTVEQLNAVPNSRTINSKPLTSNITLTASDVGADASGSASTAESNAKSYTNTQISNLSTSVDTKLSGKADSSHGTHVTYSTTAPVMDGTASVGSASTVARSDHKHPTDTSRASQTDLTSHVGDTIKHVTSTERTNWNAAKTHADSTHAPTNAEKNQNAFSNIKAGSTTISADTTTDTFEFVAGSNITLTPDATNDKLTISATNTTYNAASQTASGLMSAADKTKLDGIATGADKTTVDSALSSTSTNPVQNKIINSALANKVDKVDGKGLSTNDYTTTEKNKLAGIASGANAYTHPTTAGNKHIPSGGSSGQILRWSSDGTAAWGADNNTTYSAATTSAAGLMSAADKTKLNGIATGANAYTHPTTTGNKHIPSGGSSGQILRWSADGTAAWGADNNTTYSVATSSTDGLTPKADASAGTISSQANQWVLTRNGTTVDWYKLPANAFNNSTYSLSSFGVTATASELNQLHNTYETKTGWKIPSKGSLEFESMLGETGTLGLTAGSTYTLTFTGMVDGEVLTDSITGTAIDGADEIGIAGIVILYFDDIEDFYIYDNLYIDSSGNPTKGNSYYWTNPTEAVGTNMISLVLTGNGIVKTYNNPISELPVNISGYAQSLNGLNYTVADLNDKLTNTIGRAYTAGSGEIFNDYENNEAIFMNSHAEGTNTCAYGEASHAEGYETQAMGIYSHAEGRYGLAYGSNSHVEGNGYHSGRNVTSSDFSTASAALSYWSYAPFGYSHRPPIAFGEASHVEGYSNLALGNYSHVGGYYSYSYTYGGFVHGWELESGKSNTSYVKQYTQTVFGKYNVNYDGPTSASDTTGSLFIIGNGTSTSSRSNALRITTAGQVMGTQSFTASGADYAEYYEWADGNPNNEDRRGRFVTYEDGDKIRIANNDDDYILGVISSRPAIIGNGYTDEWQGRYLTDVYGERLTEIVEIPEEEIKDEDGNVIEIIPAHIDTRFILNPDYDAEQEYVGRDQRPEWAVVGTHGQLVLIDNGTCTVNSYCTVGDDGTAIPTEKSEYRVIARLDDTHIRIVIK